MRCGHRRDQFQRCSDGPFSIILIGLWIAEINEDAVAHYLATNPPKRRTVSAMHFWYAEMTSRRSSGYMRAESAVEPTRSENITVT